MTLRAIDILGRDVVAVDGGSEPCLKFLQISSIRIDDSYQRPLGRANWVAINKIAGAFNWAHFGPVVAAPLGDGLFALIDGQHRTHAALLAGFDRVPALIVDLDVRQQAAAFSQINGQVTAISLFHIYKAALTAEEKWALQCRDAVEAGGARLMTYHPSHAQRLAGEIYSVGLVKKYIGLDRCKLVECALRALTLSNSADQVGVWSDTVLRPWFGALREFPNLYDAPLHQFINENDLIKLGRTVDLLRAQDDYKGLSRSALLQDSIIALLRQWAGGRNGR